MSVSVVAGSGVQTYGSGRSATLPRAGGVAGDLLIAVAGSSKQVASYSTGWTQIASIGSGSSWLAAFYRIADGQLPINSNDTLTVTFSSSGTSYAIGMMAVRGAPFGFDDTCIASHSENCTTGSGASYALVTGLSGVTSGQLSVCLGGGHGVSDLASNYMDVSGTAWTELAQGGLDGGIWTPNSGGCMSASCPTTGTPAIPSVTYNKSSATLGKFVAAMVIRDVSSAGGLAGGGLFWGA